MKRRTIIILSVIAAVIIIGILGFNTISNSLDDLMAMKIGDVDLTQVPDGTYTGSYQKFPVSATVAVTVKNHKIDDIKLLEHKNGQGAPAESIPGEVIKKGTLQVDIVSGATYSSKVILKAIQNALQSAI